MKEQIFRNFGAALGPNSDVTVVMRWSAGVITEGQVAEEDSLQHPQIVLIDPTFTLVAEELLTLEPGEQVQFFNDLSFYLYLMSHSLFQEGSCDQIYLSFFSDVFSGNSCTGMATAEVVTCSCT